MSQSGNHAGLINVRIELGDPRCFIGELFAETGGVPVPGEPYDGAFINHSDTDPADPSLNSSGVAWHTLYYKEN